MLHLLTFFLSISITLDCLEIRGTAKEFWSLLGGALLEDLSPHWKLGCSITSRDNCFSAFAITSCKFDVVLLLDEFSDLYAADAIFEDDFLRAWHVVQMLQNMQSKQ
jgi:hypothetical protein